MLNQKRNAGDQHDRPEQAEQEGAARAAEFLRALANPHRLTLLWLLSEKSCTVMELCGRLQVRQSLVSQHLARLRLDGLVSAERQGHFVIYSLRDERARDLVRILTRMFERDPLEAARFNYTQPKTGEARNGSAGSGARA